MGAVQIAIDAIRDLGKSNVNAPGQFSVIAIFVSFAVREAIFQFRSRVSKHRNEGKQAIHVTNHRLGLYSSYIVFLGVFLSVAGELYGWPGLVYMDSISAIIVSGMVLRKCYLSIVEAVYGKLAQQELEEENSANFIDTIQRVHGIITVDDLKSQEMGHYIVLHVKVSVNPRITVSEANDISERAKKLLMNRFLHVSDVNIQVAPYDPGYPYKTNNELSDQDIPTLLQ
ncbi:ferrous iron efflux protein F [compost metagenome]